MIRKRSLFGRAIRAPKIFFYFLKATKSLRVACGMTKILFSSALLFATVSCGHLTSAPKPIEPRAVAMGSTNKPDADIVDCDAKGCLVRQVWLDSYFKRETKWKENIPADKLIHAEGDFFRIPYLCINHNSDMRRRERLAEAAP